MALFLPHSIAENLAQLTFLLPVYAAVFARFPSAVFGCVCMFLLLFVEGTRCDVCFNVVSKILAICFQTSLQWNLVYLVNLWKVTQWHQ